MDYHNVFILKIINQNMQSDRTDKKEDKKIGIDVRVFWPGIEGYLFEVRRKDKEARTYKELVGPCEPVY